MLKHFCREQLHLADLVKFSSKVVYVIKVTRRLNTTSTLESYVVNHSGVKLDFALEMKAVGLQQLDCFGVWRLSMTVWNLWCVLSLKCIIIYRRINIHKHGYRVLISKGLRANERVFVTNYAILTQYTGLSFHIPMIRYTCTHGLLRKKRGGSPAYWHYPTHTRAYIYFSATSK